MAVRRAKLRTICQLRITQINNEPWFVGKDVATALGYVNTNDVILRLVADEDKRGAKITTPGGNQQVTVINESGLYSLILSSKLPQTKEFKQWVTKEVLPSKDKPGKSIALKGKSLNGHMDIWTYIQK